MKHIIFTIHDQKAEAHLPPFILPTVGMAKRTFTHCVNSDSHQFGQSPADYTLIELGSFDDQDATFQINDIPHSHGLGVEYLSPIEPITDEN